MRELAKACPIKITKILTDNGKEFSDRQIGAKERQPAELHEYDLLLEALGLEHRLTRPRTPEPCGMVERFNGRLSVS